MHWRQLRCGDRGASAGRLWIGSSASGGSRWGIGEDEGRRVTRI